MPVIKPTTVPTKTLAESINASASSFKLSDIKGWDAADLVAGDFGDPLYVVFRDSANTRMELMEIDPATIASASITITRRGLQFDGNLTTEVSANKLSWNKGDTLVDLGTDTPQLWQWLKEYIDAASIAGAVPAANITPGIVKIAGTTELNADTEDDGTYDYVPNAATLAASKYGLRLPTADEKAALDGTGTPSGSNKFVTQDFLTSVTEFTASGTWTKPANLSFVIVEAWGGGGGGYDAGGVGDAGGGGGGGYSIKRIEAGNLAATETVTVGAGGTGSGTPTAGGNTTFGSHITAYGGAGGQTGGAAGGGGNGGGVFSSSDSFSGLYTTSTSPYNGGDSIYGGGAGGSANASGTTAVGNGGNSIYGGAGGGGARNGSDGDGGTSLNGGDGGDGVWNGTAANGVQPGGGGGASNTGTAGNGAAGMVRVTEVYNS